MKKTVSALMACVIFFLIPLSVISILKHRQVPQQDPLPPDDPTPDSAQSTIHFTEPERLADDLPIEVLIGEESVKMTLHDYVVNVVAAEMPASYPLEALKAQAIAARTNAIYKKRIREAHPDRASHENADICANYAHCQAFADESAQKEKWGDSYETYRALVEQAVRETDGEVITYKGNPISAIFHSTSSGRTENAADVWGNEVPYLLSVDSHWDRSDSKFVTQATLTAEEFADILTGKYENAVLTGDASTWFDQVERSEAGGIIHITVGGVEMAGRNFRNLYGLRSANITFAVEGQTITMTVKGYGHGVGMSQFGAGAMAQEGKSAEDILCYYYTGVSIEKMDVCW